MMVRSRYLVKLFCIILFSFSADADNNISSQEILKILSPQSDDFLLGDKNSKVTIVEYSSVSCPHCAEFKKNTFPKIKSEYIDKNKILYIYRDFPINKQGLMGAMLAHCAGDAEYFKYRDILMESQPLWAYRSNYMDVLNNIAKLGGFSDKKIEACFNDAILQDKILRRAMTASTSLAVHVAPTFFINGKKYDGLLNYDAIKKIIDNNLS